MGRGGGRLACAVALGLVALAALPRGVAAYTAAGDRLFPATLQMPQISPGDEFYVWANTLPLRGGPPGAGTRQTATAAVWAKTITDRLAIVVEENWTRLDRVRRGTWSAMQNLDTEIKYLAYLDQQREFLLTFG